LCRERNCDCYHEWFKEYFERSNFTTPQVPGFLFIDHQAMISVSYRMMFLQTFGEPDKPELLGTFAVIVFHTRDLAQHPHSVIGWDICIKI